MLQYISKSEWKRLGDELSSRDRETLIEKAAGRSLRGSTFLSHSSSDAEILPGVVRILEGAGASVYLDKKDPQLPPQTSKKTAQILRDRIAQTSKFVILASENSKDSRWVPWELGIADGNKGGNNIAVIPATKDEYRPDWAETEYLGLYDHIVWGDIQDVAGPGWIVLDWRQRAATTLRQWLRQ